MKYTFVDGPPHVVRIRAAGMVESVHRGGTIELTDAQYAHFVQQGLKLEPANRRRRPPKDVTPEPEVIQATTPETPPTTTTVTESSE